MNFLIMYLIHIHILYLCGTIYYHRTWSHRHVTLSPALDHFFRFAYYTVGGCADPKWLKYAVTSHRVHHKFSDTEEDINSPHHFKTVLWYISERFVKPGKIKAKDWDDIDRYAKDVPEFDDWIQRNLYSKFPYSGLLITGLAYGLIIGWWAAIPGILAIVYAVKKGTQFIIDYLVHSFGYTTEPNHGSDHSRNLLPFGIFAGGEELHANHHNHPNRLNFAIKWWEIDIGYLWCILFEKVGLLKINK